MDFKLSSFILILLLLVSVGCVAASEVDDNITISQETPISCDNFTQDELNGVDSYKENDVLESYDDEFNNTIESDYHQEALTAGESDDVIVVSTWDELQYYCSLKDQDYTLKLKDNTSFYPTDPNDSNYQTDTQVTTAINTAIAQISTIDFVVVASYQDLPVTGVKGTFYLVPHTPGTHDIYDEYIWTVTDDTTTPPTYGYELIGTTSVDLTDYMRISDWNNDVYMTPITSTEIDNICV